MNVTIIDAASIAADVVRGVICRTTKRKSVRDHDHLHNDLKLDSLDRWELAMAIELACHIEFTEAEILHASTVYALIELVEGKVADAR